MDYQVILKVGTLIKYILLMTTFKFQSSSLLLSKLIRVQRKLDNQVYKEMIGQVQLWSQLPSDRKNIGLEKQQNTLLIRRFMLPNFRIM